MLFGIGLLLNAFSHFDWAVLDFDWNSFRIPGVLQRIALVFIACFILYHYLPIKRIYQVGVGLLVIYWVLMMFLPIPGYGTPNLDPDTNIGAWLDQVLLGSHMYKPLRDPEGLLSTVPSIVTGLIGIISGRFLFSSENKSSALIRLFVAAGILIAVGLVWDIHFPINKKIWSSSYVLVTGGLGIYSLAFLYWLLDVQKMNGGLIFPFRVFGLNAITVYALSGILIHILDIVSVSGVSLREYAFNSLTLVFGYPKLASLMFAVAFTSLCYVPIWVMYKKGIFLKV